MGDRREWKHQWYDSFDHRRMVFIVDDQEIPAKYEVCGTCDGKGTHVNPSIDSNGISPEEFAEDPDFAEMYFGGVYDQVCVECHGEKVSPVIDEDRCSPEVLKMAQEHEQGFYQEQEDEARARRMGY